MSDLFNGIEEGSVVRIKFKTIPEITKNMKLNGKLNFLSEYDVGSNVNALVLGGDFIVVDIDAAKSTQEPNIEIDNHFDGGTFTVFSELIDTIEVIDIANKFASEDHGIVMVQVEDKIYINGVLLDNGDSGWDPKDVNRLDKFVAFMEKFVLAKAFEDSIEEESNDNS